MILSQDAAESRMEGLDDTLGLFPANTVCIHFSALSVGIDYRYYTGE